MSTRITRRQALQRLGAAAGTALVAPRLVGCGGGAAAPGQINTIVYVMMENRSYDHYFGARKLVEGRPGDGLVAGMSNPDMSGVDRPIYHETTPCIASPPHEWTAAHEQWNGGRCDGFVTQYQTHSGAGAPPYPMGYFQRQDLPVLYALADGHTSCDRWFSSIMGPTWPNRFYLHAAQSQGVKINDATPTEIPTIFHRLEAAGIPWKYYYSDAPFLATLRGVSATPWKRLEPDFFDDADAGRLPPVTVLDPGFTLNDDHPSHHPLLGQQFLSAVYRALATSPQWKNLLFVITYDEHGGFFDHVSPPKTVDERAAEGFDQLGLRVPAVVAGPYVKKGHVSSTVYDHTSILRHIENMFGLEPLTARDAAANDLSDAIDTERLAAGDPAPPVDVPAIEVDQNTLDPACFGGHLKCELELFADAGGVPAEHDRRAEARDVAEAIGARLDRWGLGRIRRK